MNDKKLGIGPRTADFLKSYYPSPWAKLIARDFNVSPATANLWLQGKAPTTAHLEEMMAKFGLPFVQAVFIEACENKDPRVDALVPVVVGQVTDGRQFMNGFTLGVLSAANRIANWISGSAYQALRRSEPMQPHAQKLLLIEQLIQTVPLALPAPDGAAAGS